MINETYLKRISEIEVALQQKGVLVLNDFVTVGPNDLSFGKLKRNFNLTSHSYMVADAKVSLQLDEFISRVTGKKPKKWEMRVFSHRDYAIISDETSKKSHFEAVIDLTQNWNEEWGGSVVFVDGTGDYLKIPPKNNSVSIAIIKNRHSFVQYVNHKAGKLNRIFLVAIF